MNRQSLTVALQKQVGSPRSRPTRQLSGRLEGPVWISVRLRNHGASAIALPEDDVVVVDLLDGRWQPSMGILEPSGQTRESLLERRHGDGPPLGVVAVKEGRIPESLQHEREFPRQIVRIMNARVSAE